MSKKHNLYYLCHFWNKF